MDFFRTINRAPFFNLFRFVVVPIPKSHDNEALTYLYVESNGEGKGNAAVGSDGKRMHYLDIPCVEPGLWRILKHSKTDIQLQLVTDANLSYSNWRPRAEKPSDVKTFELELNDVDMAYYNLIKNIHMPLKYSYFTDVAIMYCDVDTCCVVTYSEPGKAIFFDTKNYHAVVMPMRKS